MKHKTLILTILSATILSLNSWATPSKCDESNTNCYWELEGGVLTITGSGNMPDFDYDTPPWDSVKNSITSIIVSEGITSVGSGAFLEAMNVSSVSLPETLETIGNGAFLSNRSLESINIPSNVLTIADGAFGDTGSLESITFSENSKLTTIGGGAFAGTSSLESITIPASVTSIAEEAFYESGLSSVTILSPSISIGPSCFYEAGALDSLVISGNVIFDSGPNGNITNTFENVWLSNLTISADAVAAYLDQGGHFESPVIITCTKGDCQKALEDYDEEYGTDYLSMIGEIHFPKIEKKNADGSIAIYDSSGKKVIGYKGKRIYTLEEANQVAGVKNRVSIKYR